MSDKFESRIASMDKKYRSMAVNFIDAIWVVDAYTLKYLYISPDIYKLRGFKQEEVLGSDIKNSFTPDSYQKTIKLLEKGKEEYDSGVFKSYRTEVELYNKNGSTVWLEISAKFVQEKDEPLKIVGVTRNIDKRKKIEQEQISVNKQLKKALREKEELISKVKKLESLLPICSGCRRIRDDNNTWWPLEKYIESKADSKFTHTICPDCKIIYYPDDEI